MLLRDRFQPEGSRNFGLTIVLGGMLMLAGLAAIAGRNLRLTVPVAGGVRLSGAAGMILFGIVYAITSLACSIGPFLAITTVAMNRTVVAGLVSYATYASGMGLIILTISVAAAVARPRPVRRLRRLSGWAQPLGGTVMVLAGAYAIWYGRWELAIYSGDLSDDRIVNLGERLRTDLVQVVERVGAPRLALLIVVSVSAVAVAASLHTRRNRPTAGPAPPADRPGVPATAPSEDMSRGNRTSETALLASVPSRHDPRPPRSHRHDDASVRDGCRDTTDCRRT